jgi:Ca-activated chloride channel family protein
VVLLPAGAWWLARRRLGRGFSSAQVAAAAGGGLRSRLLALPAALIVGALLLLVVALGRPQQGLERVVDVSRGVAMELVVDRSGSMGELLPRANGSQATRLPVVQEVVAEFIGGSGRSGGSGTSGGGRGRDGDGLPGRTNDLVGLITFARYADTLMPLTLAHDALAGFLETVEVVAVQEEDGTALGDALALAAARLRRTEEELAAPVAGGADVYEIKSKIIVVLTDGRNNLGERTPLEAAELAAGWGIKVYTIGIGQREEDGMASLFGLGRAPGQSLDAETLQAVAAATGGVFRAVYDEAALRDVHAEIDRLETSEVASIRYTSRRERFVPFVLVAIGMLAAAALLDATLLRRAP